MMDNTKDLSPIFMLIGNLGFPIVITMYLLFRFEVRIKGLENAIHQLKDALCNWRGN